MISEPSKNQPVSLRFSFSGLNLDSWEENQELVRHASLNLQMGTTLFIILIKVSMPALHH